MFGPGAAAESNFPEIEIATTLGDATDKVIVYGTESADYYAAGQNGFALNSDGDVDVTFAPGAFPLEVNLLGGDDYFNGVRVGAGLHFLGPIVAKGGAGNESLIRSSSEPDILEGGDGNDILRGQEANDTLDGGFGDDSHRRRGEDDHLIGGPGVDDFLGSGENDTMFAHDDEPSTSRSTAVLGTTRRESTRRPQPVAPTGDVRPSRATSTGSRIDLADADAGVHVDAARRERRDLVRRDPRTVWGGDDDERRHDHDQRLRGTVRRSRNIDQRGGFFWGPARRPRRTRPRSRSRRTSATRATAVFGTEARDVMAGMSGVATRDGDVVHAGHLQPRDPPARRRRPFRRPGTGGAG